MTRGCKQIFYFPKFVKLCLFEKSHRLIFSFSLLFQAKSFSLSLIAKTGRHSYQPLLTFRCKKVNRLRKKEAVKRFTHFVLPAKRIKLKVTFAPPKTIHIGYTNCNAKSRQEVTSRLSSFTFINPDIKIVWQQIYFSLPIIF